MHGIILQGRHSAGQFIAGMFGGMTMGVLICRRKGCGGGVICTHLLQKLCLNVGSPLKGIQDGPPLLQKKTPTILVLILEFDKAAPAVGHGFETDMLKSVYGLLQCLGSLCMQTVQQLLSCFA
jgi:hypothetical protein